MAEGLQPKRKYLEKWEKTWPWLAKAEGDSEEDRAYCTWCNSELGLFTSRFTAHEATLQHRRKAVLYSQGPDAQKKRSLGEDEDDLMQNKKPKTTLGSDATIFDLPPTQDILEGTGIDRLSTEAADVLEAAILQGDGNTSGANVVDMSMLDTGELLKGVQVKVLHEAQDSLQFSNFKMELPVVPMCTLKANAQHPGWFKEHLAYCLTTGEGHDAVWVCDGGLYRVHKFVLAAFSQELKAYLPDNEADAVIYTPDLTSEMVKSILCLIYTGEALLPYSHLNEINVGLKMIGLCGQDLTAIPNYVTNIKSLLISYPSYERRLARKKFTPIKLMPLGEALKDSYCQLSEDQLSMLTSMLGKRESTLLTAGEIENPDHLFDSIDHIQPTLCKSEPAENLVKIELEDYLSGDEENVQPLTHIIKKEKKKSPKSAKAMRKDLEILSNKALLTRDNEIVRMGNSSFTGMGWDKVDMRETRTCYPVYVKGERSKKLPYDLFDDESVAAKVKMISVCPMCFKIFDDKEKMKDHKSMKHQHKQGGKTWNTMVLGKNQYKCNKCEDVFELKHLVWFVKHYKFCGINSMKANDLLKFEEIEEVPVEDPVALEEKRKKNAKGKKKCEELLLVGDVPRRKLLARTLLGKESPEVWGCRKCYTAFEDEPTYQKHIATEHDGKIEYGTCYDPEIGKYCCPRCKVHKTDKGIHEFIYHLAHCYVNQQGDIPIDDEEDIDHDTNYEYVDPWGVVNKPLKILSFRSKWICEAIYGQLYPMLFPCHLCYNVFKSEEELRDHFRTTHPGLQNFLEHGDHYDKDNKLFKCPHCKREVCRNQRNSIFFTYHMKKCNKELYEVTRSCPTCQKSFTAFRTLQHHIQTKCGTVLSVCHICGLKVKTPRALEKHVMITHSDARPYPCKVCNRAFKRAPDLDFHMKLHLGSLDWSCDKCGKSFPVKKNLRTHMKTHMTDNEKPHVCHICGNRFMRKSFLANHLTTHSSFRGFACEVCNSQVKTKDSLKQHRRKVHKLNTPIPDECILRPDPGHPELKAGFMRSAGKKKRRQQHGHFPDLFSGVRIKEEVLPVLGEELELS